MSRNFINKRKFVLSGVIGIALIVCALFGYIIKVSNLQAEAVK